MRIPMTNGQKGCLKICQCSSQGVIEKCQPVPCFPLEACVLGGKRIGKQKFNDQRSNEENNGLYDHNQ